MTKESWTLPEIVNQLVACSYNCEAGPLENNVAFQALVALAFPRDDADGIARCCFLGCNQLAEYVIVSGPSPDDYTESCTQHIGDLLTDAQEHRIYPIDKTGD